MKPALLQTLRSRGFAAAVHLGLWVMLYLAVTHLSGSAPTYREAEAYSMPSQSPAPVARLEALFSPGIWPKASLDTNASNPFFTRYFLPQQAPPPPPPPTTRKIELTYLGYYEVVGKPKQAMVKFADTFLEPPPLIGARVASNLFVAQVTMQTLTLTNPAAQTNLLPVNIKKEIEVPIR